MPTTGSSAIYHHHGAGAATNGGDIPRKESQGRPRYRLIEEQNKWPDGPESECLPSMVAAHLRTHNALPYHDKPGFLAYRGIYVIASVRRRMLLLLLLPPKKKTLRVASIS